MLKSLTNNMFLKKHLYSLKMAKGSRLTKHLNEFNRIMTQLLSIEVKIEAEEKALLMLPSLPPSYENLVTTLIYDKGPMRWTK